MHSCRLTSMEYVQLKLALSYKNSRKQNQNWHTQQTPLRVVYSKKIQTWKTNNTQSNIAPTTDDDAIYSQLHPRCTVLVRHLRKYIQSTSRYTTSIWCRGGCHTLSYILCMWREHHQAGGDFGRLTILHTRNIIISRQKLQVKLNILQSTQKYQTNLLSNVRSLGNLFEQIHHHLQGTYYAVHFHMSREMGDCTKDAKWH